MYYFIHLPVEFKEEALMRSVSPAEQIVCKVLTENSDVHAIYEVIQPGKAYNGNIVLGTLKLRTTLEGKFFIDTFSGHSWLELEYNQGTRTTFALHGTVFTDKGKGYKVNWDLNREVAAEKCMPVTYEQLQQILDYNKNPDHLAWTLGHNCTDYGIEVWNLISGDKIPLEDFGRLVRPKELTEWIKRRKSG